MAFLKLVEVVFIFPTVIHGCVVHKQALSGQAVVVIVVRYDHVYCYFVVTGRQAFYGLVHIYVGEVAGLEAESIFSVRAIHILVGACEIVQPGSVHVLSLRADDAVYHESPTEWRIVYGVHAFAQSILVFKARVDKDMREVVVCLDALLYFGVPGQFEVSGGDFVDFLRGEFVGFVLVSGTVRVIEGLKLLP